MTEKGDSSKKAMKKELPQKNEQKKNEQRKQLSKEKKGKWRSAALLGLIRWRGRGWDSKGTCNQCMLYACMCVGVCVLKMYAAVNSSLPLCAFSFSFSLFLNVEKITWLKCVQWGVLIILIIIIKVLVMLKKAPTVYSFNRQRFTRKKKGGKRKGVHNFASSFT